ncbi:hypothetical protein V7S43_012211 [Phytophthora oleae]|uniref:Uncharacterized protein n=1 Tax=Phytophthora oleae TaxID=2107226 RepID=A0ABD3FCR3_9STRA
MQFEAVTGSCLNRRQTNWAVSVAEQKARWLHCGASVCCFDKLDLGNSNVWFRPRAACWCEVRTKQRESGGKVSSYPELLASSGVSDARQRRSAHCHRLQTHVNGARIASRTARMAIVWRMAIASSRGSDHLFWP